MKKNTNHAKKFLFSLLTMFLPLLASAQSVEINGIWYNLVPDDKQAEVTFKGDSYDSYSNEYSGAITIPSTVTYKGVEYSVTSIGDYAFSGCYLSSFTIPEGVTSIGDYAFYRCQGGTSITIPEGVTSIGNSAFRESYITSITIPEGVTSIGNSAFRESGITSITLSKGVTSIGEYAFYRCKNLTAINIPEGVTSIETRAFSRCYLKSITIPESVTSIAETAFEGGSNYKIINYSPLNISKGGSAYGYIAHNAEVVYQGSELSTVDGFQFYYNSLVNYIGNDTVIVLPDNYNGESYDLADWAFSGCINLKSITIPDVVTSIGEYAFMKCEGLEELTLGAGLKKIATNAFKDCEELKKIFCYATRPATAEGAIFSDRTYERATLYVPQGCYDRYLVMTGWSDFYNIVEIDTTGVENANVNDIKVQGHRGTLRITGATKGETISVYTTCGTLAANKTAKDGETIITLPEDQVYIVVVGDKMVKISM